MVTCMTFAEFANQAGAGFLVVGSAKDLVFEPKRSCKAGYLSVYLIENGITLQLIHKTEVTDIPGAVCNFQGRLLAGIGKFLRIYDLGQKKLLRKCENKTLFNQVISIWTSRDKIIIGDIQHSYHLGKYNKAMNLLYIFADDAVPRWITSGTQLDGTTICGGDKFGNLFVLRLPEAVEKILAEDPSGGSVQWSNKQIEGAAHKLSLMNSYYAGETITKVLKTQITPGGRDVILYTTVYGTIGVLVPFQSREDVDFYTNLEMHMRQEFKSLIGREHTSFRSYYTPVKASIDGDLCEHFALLPSDVQNRIAQSLDRSPAEVQKKLEDMRNSL